MTRSNLNKSAAKLTGGPPGKPWTASAICRAAESLGLLANPHRLELLRMLEDGPKTFSELREMFPERSHQSVSRHLGILLSGGLIDEEANGAMRIYASTGCGKRLIRAVGRLSRP